MGTTCPECIGMPRTKEMPNWKTIDKKYEKKKNAVKELDRMAKQRFHVDGCPKYEPQIQQGKCTCSIWKNFGNGIFDWSRTINDDGSGHCSKHCIYGKRESGAAR